MRRKLGRAVFRAGQQRNGEQVADAKHWGWPVVFEG